MANPTLTSAFAPSFRWTTSGGTDVAITIDGHAHNVTIPTTDARVVLGHETITGSTAPDYEPLPEFAYYVQESINAAFSGAGHSGRVQIAMNDAGLFVLALTAGASFTLTPSSYSVMSLLGFTQGATTNASLTAARPPRYLGLVHAWHGGAGWVPTIPFAGDLSQSGRAWGTRGANPGATWSGVVDLVPSSVDYLAATFPSSSVTPLYPSETNTLLSTLGTHTSQWGWADLAAIGHNARWAFALGTLQSIIGAYPTTPFDLGAIDPDSLRALGLSLLRDDYLSIVRFPLRLYRRSDVPRSSRS